MALAIEETFEQQVKLAGLMPAQDFKNADLWDVDLSDSNLRGFDFSGADLRGATGIRVQWDDTTILDGAELSGSIFAAKFRLKIYFDTDTQANDLLESISRQSWSDKILWAGQNLLSSGRYHEFALPITEALFYQARNDDFLQAELMRYLAPRMRSMEELHDMLVAAISDEPKAAVVVRSAFHLIQRQHLTNATHIRQHALMLIKSSNRAIQEEAVRFLVRNRPTRDEINTIRTVAQFSDGFLAGVYVAEIARTLGGAYEIATRDPISNAPLPMKTTISPSGLNLIARRWLRAESSRNASDLTLPLVQRTGGGNYFSLEQIEQKAVKVKEIWEKMKIVGIEIGVEADALPSHDEEAN